MRQLQGHTRLSIPGKSIYQSAEHAGGEQYCRKNWKTTPGNTTG